MEQVVRVDAFFSGFARSFLESQLPRVAWEGGRSVFNDLAHPSSPVTVVAR